MGKIDVIAAALVGAGIGVIAGVAGKILHDEKKHREAVREFSLTDDDIFSEDTTDKVEVFPTTGSFVDTTAVTSENNETSIDISVDNTSVNEFFDGVKETADEEMWGIDNESLDALDEYLDEDYEPDDELTTETCKVSGSFDEMAEDLELDENGMVKFPEEDEDETATGDFYDDEEFTDSLEEEESEDK